MAKNLSPERPPERVLVIHTAFLGDIVLATSFLANLRKLLPTAEIHFLTTPLGAKLLKPNDMSIFPIAYDKRGADRGFGGFVRMGKKLRIFRPQLVFCLHRSLRSVMLARLCGGTTWAFHDAAGSVLMNHRVPRPKNVFEAEKNHVLLTAWAGDKARDLPLFPMLSVTPEDASEGNALLGGLEKFVAIAPSSVWATKRWPADRFAALVKLLWEKRGFRCVIIGGTDAVDAELAGSIVSSMEGSGVPAPLNLTGKTGLGTLKWVLSRASLVISNDSGPLHVAISMGAKVLAIFGPTTKSLGFFPFTATGKSDVVENIGLECRPCGLHGHHVCPLGHFRCMLEISPEVVYQKAEKLLCP